MSFDPDIHELMYDAGWNQTTQINVLLDFIGMASDSRRLKNYLVNRIRQEHNLGKGTDESEGDVHEEP